MAEKTAVEFDHQVESAEAAIQVRVKSYIDVLRGAGALFYTSDTISRHQFHSYVKELDLERNFPGIVNLNFARRVFAAEKKAFEYAVQTDTGLDASGYPEFSINPPGPHAEYHVLTYLEPMESNLASFGFDIASNEQVARTLANSRDTGELSSSGRLIRISGPSHHIGMAMRMPLYRRGMPTGTVQERRAAYYGSIGAGFDINKLMLGAINQQTFPHMRLKLYDAGQRDELRTTGTADSERLLFESQLFPQDKPTSSATTMRNDLLVKRVPMAIGSRVWEAEFSASKTALLSRFDAFLPWLIFGIGLLATLFLYSVCYFLLSARRSAVELATEMTKDLRESEASLGEAQHMAHLGSWLLEPVSGKMTWSAETYNIFGLTAFARDPQYGDLLRRIHEADRARVREGLGRLISCGQEFNTEHRITQRDGATRWVQTISCRGDNGGKMLLRGTIMDITERKQTVEALKRSQELLRELTAYQDRVREDERKRIAREIHDELGQTLLALRIDVSMLDARTRKSHPRLNERVREALHQIDATVKTIRTIINNLRPAVLDLGLTAAIEWQVKEFRRRSGIDCELIMDPTELVLDDARATTLFRILQESLTNVIRHANASQVTIELYEEGDRLVMTITDDGIGIYAGRREAANSFGLVGVEERIHTLHGEFLIDSAPGEGTRLTIFIPFDSTTGVSFRRIA